MNPRTAAVFAAVALAALGLLARDPPGAAAPVPPPHGPASAPAGIGDARPVAEAARARASDVWVEGRGRVLRTLADDRDGSAHQRFLLRLDDGTTLLVAHNIDIAPRLDGLAGGDAVEFRGEYVWTPKGGTVHWTHADPRGRRPGGWLRWQGRTYR
ncbi:DUF3465 domain-containing protein [Lysobacter humi (ex Lee et al. 2017)]